MAKRSRQDIRRAVHARIRKKMAGSTARPRLAVFRSVKHIYAQIIDDEKGATLCAASSVEKGAGVGNGGNMDAAKQIGKLIAERAKEKGISQVVFDRGGYLYHGRVKSLAEAAREAGLQF
jgi:large subunit ribosomal protein L18